jgi:hypothetical protein
MLNDIIVLSVAQNVFLTKLAGYPAMAVPQLDKKVTMNAGALGLINSVSAGQPDQVLAAYNRFLVDVFYTSLSLSCLTVSARLVLSASLLNKEIKSRWPNVASQCQFVVRHHIDTRYIEQVIIVAE